MNQALGSPRQEDQFREFLGVLRRRKGIVILVTLLALGLGVASILLATPSYQAVARILLSDYAGSQIGTSTNVVDRISKVAASPDIGSQIGLMESPQVVQAAFTQAGVNLAPADVNDRILSIEQENTSPVLTVQVNLPDPDSASRLVQAIPAAYNEYVRGNNETTARNAKALFLTRLNAARADLKSAQNALEVYLGDQGKGGVVAMSGGEGETRTSRLNNFEQQLQSARVEQSAAESAYQESLGAQARIPATISELNQGPSVEQIQAQKKAIADLTSELNAALVVSTEKSPEVRSLRARLKEQQSYLDQIPKTTDRTAKVRNPERAGYDQRVSESKARVASAGAQVAKLEGIVTTERAGLDAYQKRLPKQRQLANAVDDKKQAVALAQQRYSDVENLGATSQPAVQVVSTFGATKTSPVVGRTLVASTLLGIMLGMFAALLRDRFDNRIYTLEQIYDASGATPIGEVPVTGKSLALETGGNRSRTLESYRSLRYNLETSNASGAVQSVLVSSASAGEGRAGLSLNLATEAASDMRKTILVDGDLRTPDLHDRFKLARGPGLSDVLSGKVSLQDALRETGQDNLLFLPSGAEHPNPLELLTGPSMQATHEALKEMADVIIFNSPSLMRYSDGRAIARVTDSTIFVAKRGFTRRDAMRYCVGMLRRAKASFLGVVLVDEGGRASDVPYFATE